MKILKGLTDTLRGGRLSEQDREFDPFRVKGSGQENRITSLYSYVSLTGEKLPMVGVFGGSQCFTETFNTWEETESFYVTNSVITKQMQGKYARTLVYYPGEPTQISFCASL